jgi:hypothetical protein
MDIISRIQDRLDVRSGKKGRNKGNEVPKVYNKGGLDLAPSAQFQRNFAKVREKLWLLAPNNSQDTTVSRKKASQPH